MELNAVPDVPSTDGVTENEPGEQVVKGLVEYVNATAPDLLPLLPGE